MMREQGFTPQTAVDEVLRQAGKIDNLVPRLTTWTGERAVAVTEALETGGPPKRIGTEADVETAKAVLEHAIELRNALGVLERTAGLIIEVDIERKRALLDGFLT